MEPLEKEAASPDFWNSPENAAEVSQKISDLRLELAEAEGLEARLKELREMNDLAAHDAPMAAELEVKISEFSADLSEVEARAFLSGKYDKNSAILEIYSGAGGVDAQDWATLLLRMYERYCAGKSFKTKLISQSFGEGVGPEGRIGTKAATMEVKGKFAYGILKNETGVHRLVRLSPFSSKSLRHTSFALVEVLPELTKKDETEIIIKPDELKVDVFKSSGPGGQNVNKRETAVRITHLPTGISVASQTERLQAMNKERAMSVLYAKLSQLKEEERKKEMKEIRGEAISASWGNQIRSFVLHPYKLVKDLRTGFESTNPDEVLSGRLEEFIQAEIKL